MEIKRSGSQPSGKGPADYFTGAVRVDPLFQAPDPARVVGASTFLAISAHAGASRGGGRNRSHSTIPPLSMFQASPLRKAAR